MKTDPHTLTSNATHAPGGVIYWFRTLKASGPGWQTRMNQALRDWLKTHRP
ncbi:MAG: BrnA antitoxin family protein [Pusillimonas sp.]